MKFLGNKILALLVPRIAWLYINFVAITSKITWQDLQFLNQVQQKNSTFIYAFWHGRQVFFTRTHRGQNIATLVSQSKDGEYIARVIDLFGMQTVRGSSSRGGLKAMLRLAQKLQQGSCVALTPDGPKGPQRSVKEGILFLAQKSGKPILPISWSCRRKWVFDKGWDSFWLPKPFNHFTVSYGKPITISSKDNLEQKAADLAQELNRITNHLDSLYTPHSSNLPK